MGWCLDGRLLYCLKYLKSFFHTRYASNSILWMTSWPLSKLSPKITCLTFQNHWSLPSGFSNSNTFYSTLPLPTFGNMKILSLLYFPVRCSGLYCPEGLLHVHCTIVHSPQLVPLLTCNGQKLPVERLVTAYAALCPRHYVTNDLLWRYIRQAVQKFIKGYFKKHFITRLKSLTL